MIERIEQLLRMHGYVQSDANEETFYVKVTGDESKGIYLLKDRTQEDAFHMFQEGKEVLGDAAHILILLLQTNGEIAWLDYERQFDELKVPIAMMLESLPEERKETKSLYIPKVTIVLVLINLVMYIITKAQGDAIYEWGASSWQLIVNGHEWYRLFTSNYLHFGFDHLFNNMIVLCILGYQVERYMGIWRYFILYTGAGLAGSILSVAYYMTTNQNVISAGASGAIFGLVGALLVVTFKNRGKNNGIYGRGFIIVILGSLYHGISSAGIDNSAHIGGFLGGAILALILYRRRQEK